ncbi:hypothetical protein ScPMuIL_005279 [Solemya velum]
MEDLDALLADLQTTTAHINQYQHHSQQSQSQSAHQNIEQDDRSDTPPPLPPPPQFDQVRNLHVNSIEQDDHSDTPPPLPPPPQFDQPIYEPQTVIRDRTPSSDTTSRSSDPLQTNIIQDKHPQDRAQDPRQMSALGNNLSELDQLLEDLNSAQFMAEVDRRQVATQNMVNGGSRQQPPPPPVAPKPARHERSSVDNLLDQLESSVPAPVPQTVQMQNESYTKHSQFAQHQQTQNGPQGQAASTATRELDDLMASLSEFKMKEMHNKPGQVVSPRPVSPQSDPPYAKPNKSRIASQAVVGSSPPGVVGTSVASEGHLESMLGDLESDMSRQGVATKTKGLCAACKQPVVGQVITALGRIWHTEHFTCTHCSELLGTKNFYERDGNAYCETDYHALFAPKCAYCNSAIVDKCVTALEKTWHPEHFFCALCGRAFGEEGFHEKDGKAYCREDYLDTFAPKCGGCGRPILDNYISALNRQWHPECFVCWDCHQPFGGRSFFDHEGLPYCETHYHAKRGSLCAGCQMPITGRCVTAMYKKFHPEHFVCAFCLKQLNKGTFKEQNDRPYCHPCFVKLFG